MRRREASSALTDITRVKIKGSFSADLPLPVLERRSFLSLMRLEEPGGGGR